MNYDYILLIVSLGFIFLFKVVWFVVFKRGLILDYYFFFKLNNNVFNLCMRIVSKMFMFKMNLWK